MGRRKSKFLDDGSDSDSDPDGLEQDDGFDPDDPDVAAERELFANPYQRGGGRRKRKRNAFEDDEEGEEEDSSSRSKNGARRSDYTKAPSFVSAGGVKKDQPVDNLSTILPIDQPGPGQPEDVEEEDEDAMDIDGSNSSEEEDDDDDEDEEGDEENPSGEHDDQQDLPPVPGLSSSLLPPPPPAPTSPPTSSLGFAPRGIGSKRGGIGSGGGGIGSAGASRGGIGTSSSRGGIGAAPSFSAFTASTSASDNKLGELGKKDESEKKEENGFGGIRAGIGGARAGIGRRKEEDAMEVEKEEEESTPSSSRMGLGARSGIASSSGGGIGHKPPSAAIPPPAEPLPAPSSSAAPPAKRSFLPTPPSARASPAPLSKTESAHFSKLASSNNIGFKMLQKAGWKIGEGLGADGQGIVTPLGEGAKARKRGEGIRTGERTKESRREEARRLGLPVDELSDSDSDGGRKKKKKPEKKKDAGPKAWQEPSTTPSGSGSGGQGGRKKTPKTTYKTYEELIAEAGEADKAGGVGLLVDLSGNALANQSISAHSEPLGSNSRIPELLHNITLLSLTASSSLLSLTKEGAHLSTRRTYNLAESARVEKVVEEEERRLERLEEVVKSVEKLEALAGGKGDKIGWDEVGEEGERLRGLVVDRKEWEEWEVENVGVASIAPLVRKLYSHHWNPLEEPTKGLKELKAFKRTFVLKRSDHDEDEDDEDGDRAMTPFESLLWVVWLPKVRSAINNHWDPFDPAPALLLLTSWTSILPSFLLSNLLDQLILPKLSSAISSWTPSTSSLSLGGLVFPWLEDAGISRMANILEEGKRKVGSWVRSWKVKDGEMKGLGDWEQAFERSEWEGMMLKHVLPKLGAYLEKAFSVNPRQQDLEALEAVLGWEKLLGRKMMDQLMEVGFCEKWLEALWTWLVSDGVRGDQVAEWYSWWKGYFSETILELDSVRRAFRKGLDLMNQAMSLGEDAKYRLKKPSAKSASSSSSHSHHHTSRPKSPPRVPPPSTTSISFQSIVADICESNNLLFLPLKKVTSKGQALYRVAESLDGKKGVTIYLESDVVWVGSEEKGWNPVGVEDMIKRAKGE